MYGSPVTGIGRAVRMCGYPVAGRDKEQVMSTSSPFGVKDPKVGNCIAGVGILVARGGTGMVETTALRGSRKKVIAETGDE